MDHDESPVGLPEQCPMAPRTRDLGSDTEDEQQAQKRARMQRNDSLVPRLQADMPRRVTHHHDEDDSDDDCSSSSSQDAKNGDVVATNG